MTHDNPALEVAMVLSMAALARPTAMVILAAMNVSYVSCGEQYPRHDSLILLEVAARSIPSDEKLETEMAKARYVKRRDGWRI